MSARIERAQRVIVFLKSFQAGRVKTRLAANLGAGGALEAYRSMVARLLSNLEPLADIIVPYVDLPPGSRSVVDDLPRLDHPLRTQKGRDLGERMKNAFAELFAEGVEAALLIGSDIPQIDASLLEGYFERLRQIPAVIGPAEDGGYYLIGFRRDHFAPRIFSGIAWSTESVLEQTLGRLRSLGLAHFEGRPLRDIDTVEDLAAAVHDGFLL